MAKGYWQVLVATEDCPKTAFSTPYRLFQFNVILFHFQGAPATFQRLIDEVLRIGIFAASYLDDLNIYSNSWEEHLTRIRMILDCLRGAGLSANVRKCSFGMKSCVYLGHVVGESQVLPRWKLSGTFLS